MLLDSIGIKNGNICDQLKPRKGMRISNFLKKDVLEDEFIAKTNEEACKNVLLVPVPKKIIIQEDVKNVKTNIKKQKVKIGMANITSFLQSGLNFLIPLVIFYIAGCMLYFVSVDIFYNINLKKEEARGTIKEAKRLYVLNKCDPTTRVPALEKLCGEWECVIKNGMKGIKYTKIVIEIFAGLADCLISKFSLKSCIVIGIFLIVYLIFKKK